MDKNKHDIKFISYDGEYPILCFGKLTVEIDGKKITFGDKKSDYPKFWSSGGSINFNDDWSDCHISKGEWELLYTEDEFPFNKETLQQLIDIMNDNVEYGCCGGCI